MTAEHRPVIREAGEGYVVLDDFLPESLFGEVFAFCNAADYTSVHAEGVQKVWRLHDGSPLRAATQRYPADAQPDGTSGVIDRFFSALRESVACAGSVVGRPGQDWQEVTVTPWVYPAGSGLSLHQDVGRISPGRRYTGSYTFYVSPRWNLHWGGWLLLFGPRARRASAGGAGVVSPPWLSDDLEHDLVQEASLATAVLPAPNRIVLISPALPHLITRVDPNAGNHVRASLAGFFVGQDPGARA